MRNQLDVNGEGFELEGQWSTDGADRCFDGTVRRISSGDSMPVTCRIPLSAIRAHGERYHEEQCQISLKEDIATDFFCPLCDGAMISSSGFTPAGINYAKARGIDTFRLIDTESIDWKSYVSIPALVRSTNFKGFRVIFENFTILPMAIENSDIRALSLFSYDGTHLGSIGKIVAEKWNNDEIDDSPGEKDILIGRGVKDQGLSPDPGSR